MTRKCLERVSFNFHDIELVLIAVHVSEVICREDKIVKRHRRRRDSSVTIAVGSSLGKQYKRNENIKKIF